MDWKDSLEKLEKLNQRIEQMNNQSRASRAQVELLDTQIKAACEEYATATGITLYKPNNPQGTVDMVEKEYNRALQDAFTEGQKAQAIVNAFASGDIAQARELLGITETEVSVSPPTALADYTGSQDIDLDFEEEDGGAEFISVSDLENSEDPFGDLDLDMEPLPTVSNNNSSPSAFLARAQANSALKAQEVSQQQEKKNTSPTREEVMTSSEKELGVAPLDLAEFDDEDDDVSPINSASNDDDPFDFTNIMHSAKRAK